MKLIILLILIILSIPLVMAARQLSAVTLTSPANGTNYSSGDTFNFTCFWDYGGGSASGTTGDGNWSYCATENCTNTGLLLTTSTTDLTGDDVDGNHTCTDCGDQTITQLITANDGGNYGLECYAEDQDGPTLSSGAYWIGVTVNNPPNASIPKPANNTQILAASSIVLNTTYWDPEATAGTVNFYNDSNDLAWCTNTSVSNGSIVGCEISVEPNTEIKWYVNTTDGTNNAHNGIWNFSVAAILEEIWIYNLSETDQVGDYNLTNVFVNGTDGNSNSTQPFIVFNTTAVPAGDDSCSPNGLSNHVFQCNEGCNISLIDFNGNDVIINGTGKFHWVRNVTNTGNITIRNGCIATT